MAETIADLAIGLANAWLALKLEPPNRFLKALCLVMGIILVAFGLADIIP